MAALALGSHLLAVPLEREVEGRLALIWLPDGVSRELLVEVHHRWPQADGMHLLHGVVARNEAGEPVRAEVSLLRLRVRRQRGACDDAHGALSADKQAVHVRARHLGHARRLDHLARVPSTTCRPSTCSPMLPYLPAK